MDIDVIIPVGPGHEDICQRAAYSVRVAWDYSHGAFDSLKVLQVDDTQGRRGRSQARNGAVEQSQSDWLFFLDSDDLMHHEAFVNAHALIASGELDAVFGMTTELAQGNIVSRYQVPVIRTYAELIKHHPWYTVKMGHFVRREAAQATPFNTRMDCGEDWEYYLRLWQNYACIKIDKPLFIKCRGSHSTGPRSATGAQWSEVVDGLLASARVRAGGASVIETAG